jgi:hypothetical protein
MQNKYDDGKSNFLGPKVTQYDGHMIMTNVNKPTKRKFINIDTSFRDEYSNLTVNPVASCEVTLPDRITDVKAMVVRNIEIPMTIYNFSSAIGNNYFQIIGDNSNSIITIPDGEYTPELLSDAINVAIQSKPAPFNNLQYITNPEINSKSIFVSTVGSFTLNFAVDNNGQFDGINFKRKLGWFLGFRKKSYYITTSQRTSSEAFIDFLGLRYLYLVVDEYTRGPQNSFIAALPSSLVSKNILARVSLNKPTFPFGSFLPANTFNGYLLSDKRTYSGKVDLIKLSIKLVDDIGNPVSLNGLDFSFCLEVEHE